jgi:hypothetical protein
VSQQRSVPFSLYAEHAAKRLTSRRGRREVLVPVAVALLGRLPPEEANVNTPRADIASSQMPAMYRPSSVARDAVVSPT